MKNTSAFMGGVAVTGCCAALLGVPVVMAAGSLFGVDYKAGIVPVSCGDTATIRQVARSTPKVSGWSAAQVRNATGIVNVGQAMNVPPRGWVIAVATAMQESTLHNYGDLGASNDHDSQGLFQQRPSQGWGTPAQVRDVGHASRAFYSSLLKVSRWQSLPLTKAAQRVQRSAFPNAYAKWEDDAARLVDRITGGAAKAPAAAPAVGNCAAHTDQVASSGWVRPVSAPIGSGFRTAERSGHQGVDLIASRGTPIVAAAAGTVVHMECDRTELGYHCDHDGGPGAWPGGCGWYVDIRHAGGFVTRYCHMMRRPLVNTGDKVTAGQQIGVVGSTGHSSGPHLHFEVHTHGDRTSSSAIDPVPFMKDHGAPLGTTARGGELAT